MATAKPAVLARFNQAQSNRKDMPTIPEEGGKGGAGDDVFEKLKQQKKEGGAAAGAGKATYQFNQRAYRKISS